MTTLTLSLRELSTMEEPLAILMRSKLQPKIGYRVARLVQSLQPDYDILHAKRQEIFTKYNVTLLERTEADAPGMQRINVADPNDLPLFTDEINGLLSEEVTVNFIPLKVEDLEGVVEFTPQHFINLGNKILENEESSLHSNQLSLLTHKSGNGSLNPS